MTTETLKGAPATGLLKRRVAGRTVDVHAHLLSPAWWRPGTLRPTTGVQAPPDWTLSEEEERRYAERRARQRAVTSLADQAAYFLTEMDAAGIDLMVNHTMDHSAFPGGGGRMYQVPFERVLEECAAVRERFPGRFEHFCGVDPRRGPAESVPLFERAVREYGALGLGEMISTQWQTMPTDRALCYPLYEKAVELGVPLMQDATMARGYSAPRLFEQIARDFPALRICLGGAGKGVPPVADGDGAEIPAHDALLRLACEHENVWLDADDWQRRDEEGIDLCVDFVQRALAGPARGKVMFGSDYPVYTRMYTEEDWIAALLDRAARTERPFSDDDLEALFSRNALRFLGLDRERGQSHAAAARREGESHG